MPVETAADRAVFVNASEFGATASYVLAGGAASAAFAGIFDDPSREASLDGAVTTIDPAPTFFCQVANIPGGADTEAGDQLTVTGAATYRVIAIEPDGTGWVLLRLGARS